MARILVIDDSEKSRNLAKHLLLELNHEAYLSEDAFSALDYLEKYRFDLILLDLNMPNKSGFTFLQELRARLTHKLIPVVIISGRNALNDVKRAINLNALSYIIKPFTPEQFKEKITFHLQNLGPSQNRFEQIINSSHSESKAVAHFWVPTKILKIMDIGVTIESTLPLSEGQILSLNSPLFSYIGIESPTFKVLSCKVGENQKYTLNLLFEGQSIEVIQKVKSWITSENPFK